MLIRLASRGTKMQQRLSSVINCPPTCRAHALKLTALVKVRSDSKEGYQHSGILLLMLLADHPERG
jgi:hypothetical protein